ncbi:hypothetical protein DM02DRAFT_733756 [Periconia macrospinosa]|uniref:Uncharacterized protein n=1 Tax=Periconia macrospinosa TaxID=97972 RepID=A0A2V1D2V0_9PLEO|nr:hypothetical protein DM02DRAFT_733756 [Periconia macrospinosa]
MGEIRWDAMAAFVALIGLPLMLSGGAAWLMSRITSRFMRWLWPQGSTCERLQWSDIPNGPLRENDPKPTRYHSCDQYKTPYFKHDDRRCLNSTLGMVFQKAWTSPQQRDRRVFKPYQLDPRKIYVRIDEKVLRAYVLMSREDSGGYQNESHKVVQFKEIDGVLTAHLTAARAQLHYRTKQEIEMILQGYPPFYLATIHVSDTVQAKSPISSYDDVTRAGWIVAIGLDSHRTPPLKTHNMGIGCDLPEGWKHRKSCAWITTTMVYSVKRFGEALENLQVSFPNDERIKCANEIFSDLTTGKYNISNTRPQDQLYRYPALLTTDYYETREYRLELGKDQWELAMCAFNRLEPLTHEGKELFRNFMVPILQAAIVGLLHVFLYEHYRNRPQMAWKLPTFSEIQGRKHIYLTSCESVEDD